MGKKTCMTCTTKKYNSTKIPLWSKKDGLYSMLPKSINCNDTYNPNKQELTEEEPEIIGTKLEVSLDDEPKNQWIFYWAAEACDQGNPDKVDEPAKSYGDESNRGLQKTNEKGEVTFVLNCPKLYKEDGSLYPRHVHYTTLTEDNVWDEKIKTLEILCDIPYETMKGVVNKKNYIIFNALSGESYEQKHIPNSLLFHHESLKGYTNRKKKGIIKQRILDNISDYPLVKEYYDETKEITEIPIIVYCAHETCDASLHLKDHLFSAGYYNVTKYSGGTKEWFSYSDPLFEGVSSDEEDTEEVEEIIEDSKEVPIKPESIIDNEELLIYDGIDYTHNTETTEVFKDVGPKKVLVGTYGGTYIEWISNTEWKNHQKRISGGNIERVSESDSDDDDDSEPVVTEGDNPLKEDKPDNKEIDSHTDDEDEEGVSKDKHVSSDDDDGSSDDGSSDEDTSKGQIQYGGSSSNKSELKHLLDTISLKYKKNGIKKKDCDMWSSWGFGLGLNSC